ncbi:MAG: signal recognition particle-docking protein FtsY [Desulfobulbaceae bacterium]|jgi:fused signal recognition particle receptor|nr:signal recognition particle-docking protein FtsY [Desulfobulbaceae bacterium]MDY0351116.1 signal recognition particle-docking protein FtsY [Desulfobulbaceae bacterium]
MLGWFRKRRKKEEQEETPFREGQQEEVSDSTAPPPTDTGRVMEEPALAAPARSEEDAVETGEIPAAAEQPGTAVQPPGAVRTPPREPERKKEETSLFSRLQKRLSKTRKSLVYRLDSLFLGKKEIDQGLFDELEEILITADLGVATTHELLDDVKKEVRRRELKDPQALKAVLKEQILAYLLESDKPGELVMPESGPFVIMVVGVNGVGKTTSIGKMAAKFARSGSSVLLVAADTFRAAAIDQLKIWAERCGVDIVAQKQGADPSAVVYDAIEYGLHRNVDVIIVDTAGRLHTQVNLMEELKKIKRVIGKKLAGAPHEVMLIIDATTGQNGISQAKLFNEAVEITGLTLTKLDGTAKGGIIVNICREIGIPVRFIGIGEKIEDLRDFDPREFVDALFANFSAGSAPEE